MRIDHISLLAVAIIAAGCSTSRQQVAQPVYPPAELVQVAPGGDGERVDVGVVVRPGWFAETVNPIPQEHNAATVAYAVPRVVGATAAAAWRNKLATLGIVAGSVVAYKTAQGELSDLAFWDDEEREKDPKGFKARGPVIERPDVIAPGSYQQVYADRGSCQWIGSSSQTPTVTATYGASGSSACHIDLKPSEEHAE